MVGESAECSSFQSAHVGIPLQCSEAPVRPAAYDRPPSPLGIVHGSSSAQNAPHAAIGLMGVPQFSAPLHGVPSHGAPPESESAPLHGVPLQCGTHPAVPDYVSSTFEYIQPTVETPQIAAVAVTGMSPAVRASPSVGMSPPLSGRAHYSFSIAHRQSPSAAQTGGTSPPSSACDAW